MAARSAGYPDRLVATPWILVETGPLLFACVAELRSRV